MLATLPGVNIKKEKTINVTKLDVPFDEEDVYMYVDYITITQLILTLCQNEVILSALQE